MADDDQQKPRTAADKERSRQKSRAVSGKDAARGVTTGKPGQARKPASGAAKGARGPQGAGASGRSGRRPPPKGPGRGGRPSAGGRKPPRSHAALYTWGAVGLVVALVIVLVTIKALGSSATESGFTPKPLSATMARQVTAVPESVFNKIGITSPSIQVSPPRPSSKKEAALSIGGKPGVFYMGGEFCPFCAAQRWAIATALSRFGHLSGLETMQSSSTDVDPNTPTITFAKATYTSPYIGAWLLEYYARTATPTHGHKILEQPTTAEQKLVDKFDNNKFTGGSTTSSGSIPFVDVGNKVFTAGASYTPTALQGLTRTDIAAGLSTASNPVTEAIISSANYLSASICSIDGAKPASVCTGKGVKAAAKTMGLKF